jgi:hypothetical protein
VKSYFYNVAVGLDMFLNCVCGGLPDETISSRSGRAKDAGKLWGKLLAGTLNAVFPHHTTQAEQGDEHRAEVVETIEEEDLSK